MQQYTYQAQSRMVGSNQFQAYSPIQGSSQIGGSFIGMGGPTGNCIPCQVCQEDLVDPRPVVEKPPPKSRIQYRPVQRSIIQYEVRQMTQKKAVQRQVTQYREQKRTRMVPRQKVIKDYYAVEKIIQYVPQYKQQVKIQQVPAQKITWKQDIIQLGTRTIIYKPNQRPELFIGQYRQQVADIRRGEWIRIDKSQINPKAKWIQGEITQAQQNFANLFVPGGFKTQTTTKVIQQSSQNVHPSREQLDLQYQASGNFMQSGNLQYQTGARQYQYQTVGAGQSETYQTGGEQYQTIGGGQTRSLYPSGSQQIPYEQYKYQYTGQPLFQP